MQVMLYGILILTTSLVLGGCSVSQLFSQLTQSKEEAAAGESVEMAKLQAEHHQLLENNRASYLLSTPLMSPPGLDGVSGLIYAYMNPGKNGTDVEIIGYIPRPESGTYHAWLTNEEQSEFKYVGELNQGVDTVYRLKSKLPNDMSPYLFVIVSRDEVKNNKPDNPVLAGKLIETSVGSTK